MDVQDAMEVGRRAVNIARAFNLRHGISAELDCPSLRYGSTPLDGNAAGQGIMPHWDRMLSNYYNLMGWSDQGIPLPETLRSLGLEQVISDLYGKEK
jgi:aldehyde:ferredoxin oxidoreductase